MTAWVTPPSKPPKSGIESSEVNGRIIAGEQEIIVYNDEQVRQEIASQAAQLADNMNYVIKASDFSITTASPDNKTQIINALNHLKSVGGGTLLLPFGTIRTSPISFQGYDNIVIKGIGRSVPYTTATTIKIVGTNPAGSVGLQFSDTTNPNPSWNARFCKVEGLFLECDNKCDVGINGNLGLNLHDVMVRRARVDGIVLEDFSYPVYITQSASQYNGRHGIYVRGGKTTAYSLYQCEFSYNNGYGIVLEGGASASFRDCFTQTNKRGGIKLNYVSGYTGQYYLENIKFENQYTELNGTLLDTDTDYEGNYALVITGYDKTNSALLKAKKIHYTGVLNASSTGKALKVDAVYGCQMDATIYGAVDITNGGVMGLEFGTAPTSAAVPAIGTGNALTSYYNLTAPAGKIFNGLIYPSRGKQETYIFKLTSIAAGATVRMEPSYFGVTGLSKGYKMFSQGSVVGVALYKGNTNGTVAGTLTIRPVYAGSALGLTDDPTLGFTGFTPLSLSSTDMQKKAAYNPGAYPVAESAIIGLEVTASADYQAGFNTALIGYLIVEQ